ncbi:MAG: Hsp20/alpha crystallin family protein [Gammaproteobacteria bacterium]|nr:Hsp20/alpha crystallin family protein [Gammaproteobacteria bacterium]
MNIVRFEPWSMIDLINRDLGRGRASEDAQTTVADWVPAVDIVEEKDHFLLQADLPGVDSADIEVSMEDGVLSVAGERHSEKRGETEGVRRIERVSGRFDRRFSLPETADAEHITAKSSNGILQVTIPKLPAVQARRITVEAA